MNHWMTHKVIQANSAPIGILQYGRYLTNFQMEHQLNISFFEFLAKKLPTSMDVLFR